MTDRPHVAPPLPPLDWVLVANAARARCFVRDQQNNALKELCSFVHPASRLKASELDAPGFGVELNRDIAMHRPYTH